ncbi:MFS transporter [Nocardioides sp. JQ2195]|uniref:MFS transporter n=1 Tax=Nocardioides sp. JQ2195 TaxID=2592334 RepID=UPI00143E17B4|nr:MFS transporter [Nocardioides sp. JQ2195]QIX28002.1 MFS transporter [Nocardioides sp. JQ2195]
MSAPERPAMWSPWRSVMAFGIVSLAADMVYEGMRSMAGPLLGSLGASALTVGIVTGAGEAIALGLRLVTGRMADRSGNYWGLTFFGYAMTAICVPLLAITPFLGVAGLGVATTLILLERTGKAVRSPSKSALLAQVAKPVGRGRGFAVHKALDQVGAFAGPLLIAAVAAATGHLWLAFAVLAVPGVISLVLLAQVRRRTSFAESAVDVDVPEPAAVGRLPLTFHLFASSCAAGTLGLMTFGVISFHMVDAGLVHVAVVPVVYAMAMAIEAVAALATGFAYDRWHAKVLFVLPLLIAFIPAMALAGNLGWVLAGVAAWGLATGIQDSTVKALVADLVPSSSLATAYGVFAAFQGGAALLGGALSGGLYRDHLAVLVALVAVLQVVSLALLVTTLRIARGPASAAPAPGGRQ